MLFYGLYPSQDLNISISISNLNADLKEIYKIVEWETHVDIIFCKRDSISKAFGKDDWVLSSREKNWKQSSKEYEDYVSKVKEKIEEYSFYNAKVIHLSDKSTKELKNIISKINKTKTQDLGKEKNSFLSFMDYRESGSSYKFTLPYKMKNRIIYEQGPINKRHPLLYELLTFCEEQFK